jgi:hypothetical protein
MRPRPILLLCVALFFVEVAKIIATCFLAFLLLTPTPGELYFSGFLFEILLSVFTIISLVGVLKMRWWGVYLYIFVSTVAVILALVAEKIQVFAILFAILIVIMMIVTILPYREDFR